MDLGLVTVVAITALAYFLGMILKNIEKLDDKWIPVACGGFGIILGIVAFYIHIPDMPATDPINAAAIGFASGLAATGVHQVYKQLFVSDDSAKPSSTPEAEITSTDN